MPSPGRMASMVRLLIDALLSHGCPRHAAWHLWGVTPDKSRFSHRRPCRDGWHLWCGAAAVRGQTDPEWRGTHLHLSWLAWQMTDLRRCAFSQSHLRYPAPHDACCAKKLHRAAACVRLAALGLGSL